MAADAAGGLEFAVRPGRLARAVPGWVMGRRAADPGRVLLTFDDGPHPAHTPAVLDRLARLDIRAIFFLPGRRVRRAPALPARIRAAGHALGNHTFHHARLPLFGFARAWREVGGCQRLVAGRAGAAPEWFRPPFGRLTPGLLAAAWWHRLAVLGWSLDANDWRCRSAADAARCGAAVAAAARPGDVILFHDDHEWIGPILDVVLPALAARGLLGPPARRPSQPGAQATDVFTSVTETSVACAPG